jgi:hypothetical protein
MAMNSVDKNTYIIVCCVLVCAVIGIAASKILGPDNAVEQVSEEVIDDMVRDQFHIPLRIDLSPEKK